MNYDDSEFTKALMRALAKEDRAPVKRVDPGPVEPYVFGTIPEWAKRPEQTK